MKKLLIGGQALRSYGSSRHTSDFDYLVFNSEEKVFFFTEEAERMGAKLPTIVQKFVEKGIFANEIAKIWKQIETR